MAEENEEANKNLLHFAEKGNSERCLEEIKNGANIHTNAGFMGCTPLLLACLNGHTDTVSILMTQCGANIHDKNKQGWTCLHYACNNGFEKLAMKLLDLGADINVQDKNGKYPGGRIHRLDEKDHMRPRMHENNVRDGMLDRIVAYDEMLKRKAYEALHGSQEEEDAPPMATGVCEDMCSFIWEIFGDCF